MLRGRGVTSDKTHILNAFTHQRDPLPDCIMWSLESANGNGNHLACNCRQSNYQAIELRDEFVQSRMHAFNDARVVTLRVVWLVVVRWTNFFFDFVSHFLGAWWIFSIFPGQKIKAYFFLPFFSFLNLKVRILRIHAKSNINLNRQQLPVPVPNSLDFASKWECQ